MTTINSINSNIPIEVSKGGSNATSMTTSYGAVYYDGSKLVTVASVGSSGDLLTSNGVGVAPSFQGALNTLEAGFYGYLSADTAYNKTGNNTWYVVPYNSERFDIGGDFSTAGDGNFTAPSTGYYLFMYCPVMATSTSGITKYRNNLSTTGTYAGNHDIVGYGNPESMGAGTPSDSGDGASGRIAKTHAVMIQADASDTTRNWIRVNGQGSDATGVDAVINGSRSVVSGFILGT